MLPTGDMTQSQVSEVAQQGTRHSVRTRQISSHTKDVAGRGREFKCTSRDIALQRLEDWRNWKKERKLSEMTSQR